MEAKAVVAALGALAQPSRLEVFRLLVRHGPSGVPAGEVATALGLPSATLSFHLAQLAHAGLVSSRREGRRILYAADYEAMRALLAYLMANCCEGSCAPPSGAMTKRRRSRGAKS